MAGSESMIRGDASVRQLRRMALGRQPLWVGVLLGVAAVAVLIAVWQLLLLALVVFAVWKLRNK